MDIKEFIKFSTNNRSKIFPDEKVSCYYCCETFLGKYIEEYTADNCAICPCGVDSIVPFEVDEKTLKEASKYWFGTEEDISEEDYYKKLESSVENIDGIKFIKG